MTQRSIHILIGEDAQQHSHVAKESGDNHTLYDDQFQDTPGFRTDGLADTELVGAFLHGNEHDVRHAHNTTQQRKQTYHPKERVDDSDTLFHLHTLRITVPDPNTTLVFRMRLMIAVQTSAVIFLESLIGFFCGQSVKGKL